ncbi:hypothetical protein ACF0H5_014849 [Mactra antiquata]
MGQYCKVYFWKRWFSPGHIAIELPNKMYISFWPRPKGKKAFMTASGTTYPTFFDELEHMGQPTQTLYVRGLDVSKIVAWWISQSEEHPKWELASLNCSYVVFNALCEGSEWFKTNGGCIINTPAGVASSVERYIYEMAGNTCRSSSSSGKCVIL